MTCDLCELKTITKLHYEDDTVIVLDCMSCEVPMIVYKKHTMSISQEDENMMTRILTKIAPTAYIDKVQRTIPNHLHWHARNKQHFNAYDDEHFDAYDNEHFNAYGDDDWGNPQ